MPGLCKVNQILLKNVLIVLVTFIINLQKLYIKVKFYKLFNVDNFYFIKNLKAYHFKYEENINILNAHLNLI